MKKALRSVETFSAALKETAEHNADAVNWGGPTIRRELNLTDAELLKAVSDLEGVLEATRKLYAAVERLNESRVVCERDKVPVPHWIIYEVCCALGER